MGRNDLKPLSLPSMHHTVVPPGLEPGFSRREQEVLETKLAIRRRDEKLVLCVIGCDTHLLFRGVDLCLFSGIES